MELEQVQQLYEKQKHDPPISRNLPPVAGNITWSRSGGFLSLNGTDIGGKPALKARGAVANRSKKYGVNGKTKRANFLLLNDFPSIPISHPVIMETFHLGPAASSGRDEGSVQLVEHRVAKRVGAVV